VKEELDETALILLGVNAIIWSLNIALMSL
jgi:hypothetical protein